MAYLHGDTLAVVRCCCFMQAAAAAATASGGCVSFVCTFSTEKLGREGGRAIYMDCAAVANIGFNGWTFMVEQRVGSL